jgi:uncharacterized protein (TIGR02117 family)
MQFKYYFFKLLRFSFKTLLILLGLIGFYMLMLWLLPKFDTDAEIAKDKKAIEIYIKSNGVHTDLVLPVKNTHINWSTYFEFKNTKSQDSMFQYVALGWGDKGFYLDTKSWSELKFSTAFKAAFALSSAAVHATYYNEMKLSTTCKKINITVKQYKKLIKYVKSSLHLTKKNTFMFIKTNAIYGENDAFYDATGSYSIFHSCNSWANLGLKAAGQKACLWTVTAAPMFDKY